MCDVYIGVRANWHQARAVLGTTPRSASGKISERLRRAGRTLGIRGQFKGKLLRYYQVEFAQLQRYMEFGSAEYIALQHEVDWRPVVAIGVNTLEAVLAYVNQDYPAKMTPEVFRQYESELEDGFARHLCVLQ